MELPVSYYLLSLLSATSLFYLADTTTNPNIQFIHTKCATTLFPNRCFNSLSPFADKINKNPALLTRVAITVSLSWANHFVAHLNNISVADTLVGSTNVSKALDDCINVFGDAVDQIEGSLQQMEGLNSNPEKLIFDLSNVQTWMSSAITNEDTCMVGFNGVSDGELKTSVIGRVAEVKEVTSNALSLVNTYAQSRS